MDLARARRRQERRHFSDRVLGHDSIGLVLGMGHAFWQHWDMGKAMTTILIMKT